MKTPFAQTTRSFWIRLRGLLGSPSREAEFQAELESHLQMHIDDNLRAGMTPREARREAILKLGGLEQTKQAYRERQTLPALETLFYDLRYALRMMARNPGFTAVAIISLAIGIGATSTIFSWIDAVLVRPLPGVADPGRVVALESVTPGGEVVPNSYPDYRDFRDHLQLFEGIAAYRPAAFSIGQDDHAERVWGELVTGNFFAVLGVQAAVGRLFLPSEYGDKLGGFPIAVISDRYWRSHFHADPGIAGRTLRVNQHELTIVGVAPPEFQGSMPATAYDLWIPYVEQSMLNGVSERMALLNRANRNMLGIARIRHDATMQQAQRELAALVARMSSANADVSEGMSATLLPLSKSSFGPQALLAAPLKILMGVSVLVLLIVCANVANLLLAKAASREKEFTTRLALGATRGRLTRQVLTESLLLSLAGGAGGIAMTAWMGRSLKFLLPAGQTTLALDLHWNGQILLFVLGLCVFAALLAGLAPVLHLRHLNLNQRLNENARGAGRSQRLRSIFVIGEVALALVALVGAGLFARQFSAASRIDPGFDPDHVLVSQFYLATSGYTLEQREAFCRRLQEKMESTPGVAGAAYSDIIPLGTETSWWEDLKVEGYNPTPGENMKIFRNVISPGYFGVLHIPIVEGRNFTEHDNEEPTSPNVMIVNQEFVRRFFGGRIPIGRKIHGWGDWFTVVGVARDSKYHYLGESPLPYVYFPFRQVYRTDMNLAFYVRAGSDRAGGDPEAMLATLRQKVREIDPNVQVFDAAPMNEVLSASLTPQKVAATLLGIMGSLAVFFAAIGMYSVMAYSVERRTREIGIRLALGAKPGDVLALVVRQGLALASVGLLIGACLALGLSRALGSLALTSMAMGGSAKLIDGAAANPYVYLGSAAFLCAVALLASYIPARHAAKVEPVVALRSE